MRVLMIQAYLPLILALALPLIAQWEGKRMQSWMLSFLFIGMVGISAHRVIASLLQRIEVGEPGTGH